jgi:dTMP kinase
MAGRLIVIEGVDGAGIETQANMLFEYCRGNGIPVEKLSYPEYEHPIGALIHDFLYRKFNLPVATQTLLHLADRSKDAETIKKWLDEGKTVISERYATSTIAYQGFMGFPVGDIVKISDMAGIPRPDIIVYLKVSAETSVRRKRMEKTSLDRNEGNSKLMNDVGLFYEKLAKQNTFGKWVIIDGEQTKEQVFGYIRKALGIQQHHMT